MSANNTKPPTNNNKASATVASAAPNTTIAAPSMANTSKQSINRNNSGNTNSNKVATGNTNIPTMKEETGLYEIAADNYIILLAVISAIIINRQIIRIQKMGGASCSSFIEVCNSPIQNSTKRYYYKNQHNKIMNNSSGILVITFPCP